MALSENYQFEYTIQYSGGSSATLSFGGTSLSSPDIDVLSVTGLFDSESRIGDRPFTRNHGDVPGEQWIMPKDIVFDLAIRGDSSTQGYWDLVEQAVHEVFIPRPQYNQDEWLTWRMPGFPDRMIRCRPIKRTYPRRQDQELGYARFQVMLRAADPRIYSITETDSGAQSGTFNLSNNGKANVYPRIEFVHSGTVVLTNNTFPITTTIGPGVTAGTLVADFDKYIRGVKGLIIYVGTTNEYGNWAQTRRPFILGPGTNSITLTTGTSARFYYRDTWI